MPRYNPRGTDRVYFAPTLANPASPKVTELTTENRLLNLKGWTGFKTSTSTEDASDVESTFQKQVNGNRTADASTLMLFDGDDDSDPERDRIALLPRGTTGFIVFCPDGVATIGDRARVWPIEVQENQPDDDGSSKVAVYNVDCVITDEPQIDVAIVAGS